MIAGAVFRPEGSSSTSHCMPMSATFLKHESCVTLMLQLAVYQSCHFSHAQGEAKQIVTTDQCRELFWQTCP